MAAGCPCEALGPSWWQLSAWRSCSPLAVSCGLGLPVPGATSDRVRREGTSCRAAGQARAAEIWARGLGVGLAAWTEVSREGKQK